MNGDTIEGSAKDFTGKAKEALGGATGDDNLKGEGMADQFAGQTQKACGQAKTFAKKNPLAVTALAGVLGIALINTLRGKK